MNATFTLTQPSAASPLLTRLDMSDLENVKDARAGLLAAGNDVAKLAVWAGRWGAALCDRCEELPGDELIALEDRGEVEALEDEKRALTNGIEAAAEALDKFSEGLTREQSDVLGGIINDLEKML